MTDDLPRDFFYVTKDQRIIKAGIVSSASYHLFKYARLQPYVGMRFFINVNRLVTENHRFVSPFNDVVIDLPITLQFRNNTIFNFNSEFMLGASYRLPDRLAVGIEGGSNTSHWTSFGDLQVRYLIGQFGKE